MAALEIVEGWTAPLDFQLKADGQPADIGAGAIVEFILRGADGVLVGSSGNAQVVSSSDGRVRYNPDANDLIARRSPYRARWKVTDSGGKVVFFPSIESDQWIVRTP